MIKADVFKVQRPISTNAPTAQVLVYNQSHTIEFQTPYDHWWQSFFTSELKRYVWATYDDVTEVFNIDRIVTPPDW